MTSHPSGPLRLAVFSDAHEIGGAEIALATLVGALDPDITLDVLGVNETVVARVAGGRPRARTAVVPDPASVRDIGALRALRRVLVDRSPQIFHANLNSPWSCRYAILVAASVPHLRRVAVEQLVLPMPHLRTRIVKRLTTRLLDAHVAVGSASGRALETEIGLPAGSVRTIHNAVDDRVLPAARSGSSSPTILTLARLDRVKGLDVLVDALPRLPGVHAVVAGAGPEHDALLNQAVNRGVADRLHLAGWRSDARELFDAADLFVLPSREEGLPLSIAEAMLAARAVVATDVGSVREIVVDGETGMLVPPDDPSALADAVAELLADPARRVAMGARGRLRALEFFTAPRMAREFEALYSRLTDWRPRVVVT